MFSIAITKVTPLYPNKAFIEFEVEGAEHLRVPLPTLEFFILRSETPNVADSWELLNPTGTTSFYFLDETPRILSFYNQIHYRVYTIYNNKKYFSPSSTIIRNFRRDEFLRKRKMLWDEEQVLRKFSGRRIAILKRRHIGERCPECYDPNTGNVTKSHCNVCLGTGFKEPYYNPFFTYAARLPEYKEVEETNANSGNEKDYSKMQILDYPTVNPQDIIVDIDVNDRYKVDRIESTEMRRIIVHQELVVTKLSRTSAEYEIEVENE